ncbi:MAG: alanine racemase [Anaerolineae bacterium]
MLAPTARPTYLEINLTRLKENLENIRAWVAPARVMVVLKANAYGHGVDGVAPFIAPFADYLGVATVEEGIHLRQLGITRPILVLGGTLPQQIAAFGEFDLTLTASSPDLLRAAEQWAESTRRRLKVHLKIDTGMERIGVHEYEAVPFLEQALQCRYVEIEGIFSHFANSEASDLSHARLQLERFQEVLQFFERRGVPPPLRHMANSGAILQLRESHFDMVRTGILFYGIYPGREVPRVVKVRPAATWRSRIAFSKITLPQRPVSYGSLWQAERPTRIVTLPCGYADGYFRRMTNRAQVLIGGKRYPQVGRICMDQFMVNMGDEKAEVGEEVVLLGEMGAECITAEELAEWAGTNEYEVMTNISARVPRVFLR